MKLAASQIAWQPGEEAEALTLLRRCGYTGLEMAPPRVAGNAPYEHPGRAAEFAARLKAEHGLCLCSMQSIWYGQGGSMFGAGREALLAYTGAALRFAAAAGCPNLVFGCPKNRVLPEGKSPKDALPFFRAIAEEAGRQGCVIALEANPPIYGTNFINTTAEALDMLRQVARPAFMLNLDFGAIVENDESVEALEGQVSAIHHVHISEPGLAPIVPHRRHRKLAALLRREGYAGWVSVEMKAAPPEKLAEALGYVAEVFA